MFYSKDFIRAWQENRYRDAKEIVLKFGGNFFTISTPFEWKISINIWISQELKKNDNIEHLRTIQAVFCELREISYYKKNCEAHIEYIEQKIFMITFQAQQYTNAQGLAIVAKRDIFLSDTVEIVKSKILKLTEPAEFFDIYVMLSNVAKTNSPCAQSCQKLLSIMNPTFLEMMERLNAELRAAKLESVDCKKEFDKQAAALQGKQDQVEHGLKQLSILFDDKKQLQGIIKNQEQTLEALNSRAAAQIANLEGQLRTQSWGLSVETDRSNSLKNALKHEKNKLADLEAQLAAEREKSAQLEQQGHLLLDALKQASKPEDHLEKQLQDQAMAIRQLEAHENYTPPLLSRFRSVASQTEVSLALEESVDDTHQKTFTYH